MGRLFHPVGALGATALLVIGGGAHPLAFSSHDTITVCVSHNGGALFKAPKCAKHDKKLSWHKLGPRGPQGLQGPQGVQGLPGTNGTNGTDGARNVVVRTTTESVCTGTRESICWRSARLGCDCTLRRRGY